MNERHKASHVILLLSVKNKIYLGTLHSCQVVNYKSELARPLFWKKGTLENIIGSGGVNSKFNFNIFSDNAEQVKVAGYTRLDGAGYFCHNNYIFKAVTSDFPKTLH